MGKGHCFAPIYNFALKPAYTSYLCTSSKSTVFIAYEYTDGSLKTSSNIYFDILFFMTMVIAGIYFWCKFLMGVIEKKRPWV